MSSEVNCENGKEVQNNKYIDDRGYVTIGSQKIFYKYLPKIVLTQPKTLYYLNYSNLIYIIFEDEMSSVTRFYVIEQVLRNNQVYVKNISTKTIVNESNELSIFFRYNETFELDSILELLPYLINHHLSYALNGDSLKEKIINLLDRQKEKEEVVEEVSDVSDKSIKALAKLPLTEIAKETGIPYTILWNRTNRGSKMSIEKAIAKGKPTSHRNNSKGVKPKLYDGKTLKEIAEENGFKYKTLWGHIYKGESIETAISKLKGGDINE